MTAAQARAENTAIMRKPTRARGLHDHLIRTAEVRQLQAEAMAYAVRWVWTHARRAASRLMQAASRPGTPVSCRAQNPLDLGRASVGVAFGRDLVRLAQLGRRYILEPYARRRRRRIAIAQLRALDDRLLADIGLRRCDIEQVVDGELAHGGEPVPLPLGRPRPAEEHRVELPRAA